MPRIVFLLLQVTLVVGIIIAGFAIYQKQKRATEVAQPPSATRQPKTVQSRQSRPKPFDHYQVIAGRDLFRTPKDEKPTKAAIDIEALKPTDLKLKLWGTITGQDGMTRAVIEDQTKRRQDFYRAGDKVSTATVKMILREKVVLSVKGEDQVLEIEKPASAARRAPVARAPRGGAPSPPSTPSAPQAPRRRQIRINSSKLGEISQNPDEWGQYAASSPFQGEKGENGLMLTKITPTSPLRRIGIRNGDVILAVDDQPVGNLGDILKPLSQVSSGGEMRLTIKRRGRQRNLDFIFE